MPNITHEFFVDARQQVVWLLLSDFEKFGTQLPHVVNVRYLDDKRDTSKWIVKGSLGPVTKTFSVIMKTTEKSASGFLAFAGEGDGIRINGAASAESVSELQTKISAKLNIDASGGIVGSIVNHVIETQLPQDIKDSEAKIRELLSKQNS